MLEMDVPWILQFSKYWLYSLFFALNLIEDSMGTTRWLVSQEYHFCNQTGNGPVGNEPPNCHLVFLLKKQSWC